MIGTRGWSQELLGTGTCNCGSWAHGMQMSGERGRGEDRGRSREMTEEEQEPHRGTRRSGTRELAGGSGLDRGMRSGVRSMGPQDWNGDARYRSRTRSRSGKRPGHGQVRMGSGPGTSGAGEAETGRLMSLARRAGAWRGEPEWFREMVSGIGRAREAQRALGKGRIWTRTSARYRDRETSGPKLKNSGRWTEDELDSSRTSWDGGESSPAERRPEARSSPR